MIRRRGVADQTVFFVARDASGDPVSLAYNNAGIAVSYYRPGAAAVTSISPVTQTANGAHTDGGLVHISGGLCRLDVPDAACAAGVNEVYVIVAATAIKTQVLCVELSDADPTAAPSTVSDIAAGVLSGVVEGAVTVKHSLQISNAALAGKSSNGGKTYRDLGDTKDRLAATVDGSKNRTAVTRSFD